MKHKCHITLLILLAALIAMPCKTSAQRYEFEDSEGTYQVEYVSKSHKNNNPFYTWHDDLRISVGAPGGYTVLALHGLFVDFVGENPIALDDYFSPSTTFIPPISIEYNHYVKDWFTMGVKGDFTTIYKFDDEANNGIIGNFLLGGMLNMRFEYLRTEYVHLYSSVAIGGGVRLSNKYIIFVPMIDLTYIGLSAGRNVFGFVEIGGGMCGWARAGIGCRF